MMHIHTYVHLILAPDDLKVMSIDMLRLLELLVLDRGQVVLVRHRLALSEGSKLSSRFIEVNLRHSCSYSCVVRTHKICCVYAGVLARKLRKTNVEIYLHGVLRVVLIGPDFAAVMVQNNAGIAVESAVVANL
jgi:hypothetical protein